MRMRKEIYKLSETIGSFSVSSEPCSALDIEKSSFSKWREVEHALKLVLNTKQLDCVEDKVSFAQASRSRGASKKFLSKLLLVIEFLAEKVIKRSAQVRRQSEDDSLSWSHAT